MQFVHSGYCQAAGLCGDTALGWQPGAWGLLGQARRGVFQGTTLFSARNATCLFPAHLYLLGCRDYVKERGGVPLQCCLQMVYRKGSGHELVVNQAVQCGDGAVLPLKADRLPWLLPAVSPPVRTRRCLHPPCLHHPVLPSLSRAHGALCLLQHSLTAARFIACLVHCQQHPALPTFCTARCQPCALPVLRPAPPAAPHNLLLCALHCRCRVPPAAPCSACTVHRLVHCILPVVLCAAAALCIAHSTMHHLPSYPALPAATWTACSTVQCLFSAPPYPALLRPALCMVGSSAPPVCTARSVTPGLHPVLPAASCTAHGRLHHLQGHACHALCAAWSITHHMQHPVLPL